jgi:hypothetical protein
MTEGGAVEQTSTSSDLVAAGGVLATLVALAALVAVLLLPADDDVTQRPGIQAPPLGATPGPAQSGVLTATATVVGLDTVQVHEEVTWPEGGPTRIQLAFPHYPQLTGQAATIAPRIENLVVDLDHSRVHPVPIVGQTNAWVIQSQTSLAPSSMRVVYDLHGVVIRTSPSRQHRALAVLAPLASPVAPNESTVTVRGASIRNVYCPALPREQLLCGDRIGATWEVTLPGAGSSPIIAQIDLPDTG